MKKLTLILSVLALGISLGVGGTLLYQEFRATLDFAIADFLDGEGDLELLASLEGGDLSAVRSRLEGRVWELILPMHYGKPGMDLFWEPERVDAFLISAAHHFQDHPIMSTALVSEDEAARRAALNSTSTAPFTVDLEEKIARHKVSSLEETREIIRMYLDKEGLQQSDRELTQEPARSAEP